MIKIRLLHNKLNIVEVTLMNTRDYLPLNHQHVTLSVLPCSRLVYNSIVTLIIYLLIMLFETKLQEKISCSREVSYIPETVTIVPYAKANKMLGIIKYQYLYIGGLSTALKAPIILLLNISGLYTSFSEFNITVRTSIIGLLYI